MNSVIIIPARLESTRLPRKLLLRETGKSILQHTYESACASQKADRVIVAADDHEIFQEVESFGGQVVMTDRDHKCGTDRVAEVAQNLKHDLIVNVQGDEPEISAEAIDLAIELLENSPDDQVATLATPIRERKMLEDPNCVKVVFDAASQAMYFSRSIIPCPRNWDNVSLESDPPLFFQHIGLYAYRREFLLELPKLPPTRIEKVESLEQLRFLMAGKTILVGQISHPAIGIDTPEDYAAFVRRQTIC